VSSDPAGVFFELLDRCLVDASIAFRTPITSRIAGRGPDAPTIAVTVRHERVFERTLALGNLGLAEAYMDRDFEVEEGTLADLLTVLLRNRLDERVGDHPRLALRIALVRVRNLIRGGRRNVRAHYDQGDDLFECFLDASMTYSCGYAVAESDELEALQWNKLDRICRKLRLISGMRLLDIGCGFGGLLIHAARHYGVNGVGVTNSAAHREGASRRIHAAGLGDRVTIMEADFSRISGRFDRVASVGMLEHVPPRRYAAYFGAIAKHLEPRGLGLVHAIGCNAPRNVHDPFTQAYVFPDSHQPRLSDIARHLETNRLPILDVENIVRHYGYTVAHWLRRFQANQATLDPVKYDARFRRMWEYYLSCGIAAAAASESAVYQVLFTNDCTLDLPLARV
jgi:cyclopropane-fatty-acyl-phospholipid synthase